MGNIGRLTGFMGIIAAVLMILHVPQETILIGISIFSVTLFSYEHLWPR